MKQSTRLGKEVFQACENQEYDQAKELLKQLANLPARKINIYAIEQLICKIDAKVEDRTKKYKKSIRKKKRKKKLQDERRIKTCLLELKQTLLALYSIKFPESVVVAPEPTNSNLLFIENPITTFGKHTVKTHFYSKKLMVKCWMLKSAETKQLSQ